MTDKELFYQVLNREISSIISQYLPQFQMFSGTITKYICKYIEPYVDAFLQDDKLNVGAIGEYTKQEVNSKIQNFMAQYNASKVNET